MFGNAGPDPHYLANHREGVKPTGETVHFGSWQDVDWSDTTPYWRGLDTSGNTVIHVHNVVAHEPAGQPHYMDRATAERREKADRVADAVRQAIIDGRLDPSEFD